MEWSKEDQISIQLEQVFRCDDSPERIEYAEKILKGGHDVNRRYLGTVLLLRLIKHRSWVDTTKAIELVLKFGGGEDMKLRPEKYMQDVFFGARRGRINILEILLENGLDPNSNPYPNEETSSLKVFIECKLWEHAKLLYEFGADISTLSEVEREEFFENYPSGNSDIKPAKLN